MTIVIVAIVLVVALVGAYLLWRQPSLPPPPVRPSTPATTTTELPAPGATPQQPTAPAPTAEPPAPTTAPPTAAERTRKDYRSLEDALAKTREGFWGKVKASLSGRQQITSREIENLEEILYTSDLGPKTVDFLIAKVSQKISGNKNSDIHFLQLSLKEELKNIFSQTNGERRLLQTPQSPTVWMIVGVNGAGKTTTIGKLASQQVALGKKVLIAAGDTFRAAADAQLKVWATRAEVEIFSPENVKDPSAVVFDAIQKAKAKQFDLVIVDTAGRLHTQKNLMEELKKMQRVMSKAMTDSPHEVLLVLDANSGQNALTQAQQFNEALGLTGVIITKMDGSAKGGVAVGIACEHQLPIKMIGVGEKIEDLRPFNADTFVDSII